MDEHKRWGSGYEVNVSAGRYKAHDLKLPARSARELHWFALGKPGPVERVLRKHITSLGRKVCQGHGVVLEWVVEPWHEDWSVRCGDTLTRPMPAGFGRGHRAMRGIRAPYWHPSRMVECVTPGELEASSWR